MYLRNVSQYNKENGQIFSEGKTPVLSALAHSHDNPYWSYPYHVHKDDTELLFFSEGKGQYSVNTEIYNVQKGDMMIVNKGSLHSVTSDPTDPISVWTCSIKGFEMFGTDQPEYFLPADRKNIMKSGRHEAVIMNLLLEIEHYLQEETVESLLVCNALCTALASIYHAVFQEAETRHMVTKKSFVYDILIFINEHYTEPINLDRLSKEFNMSPYHISHKFQETYGISPINYVIDRRISSAKWMLINTSDTLVSIATKVGYPNTNHFSKLFEKRLGNPPLEYRELFKSKFNFEEK